MRLTAAGVAKLKEVRGPYYALLGRLFRHEALANRKSELVILLKDTSPEELVASVRAAVAGDQILSPRITRRLIASFISTPDPGEAARTRPGRGPGAISSRRSRT